ncbi:MAG: T9SS type A sorting domain-containing protein [Bacteroidia bacterium]|nr:T9SS type A sorting domain-containing protein [Bacteroidia bacterium]
MKKLLITSIFVAFSIGIQAQLFVQNTIPSGALLQSNFSGNGIQIDNVVFTGSSASVGVFQNISSNIGLNNGILLTTGSAIGAAGINSNGSFGSNQGGSGDADLEALFGAGTTTYDAATLEFDVRSISDSLFLKLVYGSEEYSENIGGLNNDPFAIFISGPGFSAPTNLALVPGGSNPISINTINANINSGLFIDNTGGTTVQYDGFTVPIRISAQVTPCAIYHIKIVLADAGDPNGDSGLFLDAGSLQSGNTNQTVCSLSNPYQVTHESCPGACDGSISTSQDLGGFPPYTYNWSSGETTSSISNICPGNYSLTVTDHIGNDTTFNFLVFQAPSTFVIFNNPSIICTGDTFQTDLIIDGTGPFQISFNQAIPIDTINNESYSFIATLDQDYEFYIVDGNGCGSFHYAQIAVEDYGHLSGQIFLNGGLDYLDATQSIEVTLLKKTATSHVWEVKEVQIVDANNFEKRYDFGSITAGTYTIGTKVLPDNYGGVVLPTYLGDKHLWSRADTIQFDNNCSILSRDIHLVNNVDSANGSGSIEGLVFLLDYFGKTSSSTDPIPLIDIVVEKDSTPSISTDNATSFFPWNSTYAIEDSPGIFPYKLPSLPNGVFKVKVQIPGIPMIANYPIAYTTLTVSNDSIVNINFCADSFMLGRIDTCITNLGIGFSEQSSNEWEIYPNPSEGRFLLDAGNQSAPIEFKLHNLVGEVVLEKIIYSKEVIDLSSLHLNGLYIAEINGINHSLQRKLLFQTP